MDADSKIPPDVTVVVSTIRRDDAVRRFVDSVSRRFEGLPVIVADQNAPTEAMERFYASHDAVRELWLPFDCGVSYARNRALERVDTRYALLADDDFVFTEDTDLEAARAVMEAAPELGFLGGSMVDVQVDPDGASRRLLRKWEKHLLPFERTRTLITVPIDFLPLRTREVAGRTVYACDMTSNWGLLRTEVFEAGLRWDEQIKVNGEHEDFFLAMMEETDWEVAYLPELRCEHHQPHLPGYRKLRRRQGGRAVFAAKWGLSHQLDLGLGLRSFDDYRTCAPVPVPQPDVYDPDLPDAIVSPEAAANANRIEALEAELAERTEALAEAERALRAIRESRSWRLTAPARELVRRLSRALSSRG